MDYSKYGTTQKRNRIRSSSKKLAVKSGISLLRCVLICLVGLAIVGGFAAYGALCAIIDKAPNIDTINVAPSGFSTTVYDADGNELGKLVGAGANRIYKKLSDIPDCVQKAFIAIEDERFYEHSGIDVRGIFRAGFSGIGNLLAGNDSLQGASTLTQQLLKNQVFEGGNESNFISKVERKLQEQYLAIQLENIYSKDQILEYYLNTINLGQNTLGVQTAALRYFNKDISQITLSEATVIAATTKNPTYNNPITYPEDNAGRRAAILENMLEQGYISQEEYEEALADDVYTRIQAVNTEVISSRHFNSYYMDEAVKQVVEDLCSKKGYTMTQAYNLVNSGGLSIYTNQDSRIQKICDKAIANEDFYQKVDNKWELTYALSIEKEDGTMVNYSEGHLKKTFDWEHNLFDEQEEALPYIERFKELVIEEGDTLIGEKYSFTIQPQLSVCVMDQSTGAVKAIVGGRGDKTGNMVLNRATDAVRQPGSLFKVLSTYLPALDTAGFTLASVEDDGFYRYPNSNTEVHNWWGPGYEGLSSIRRGIYRSMNIVTLKFLEKVGLSASFDYLNKLGFTSLVDDDINLSVALGGLTNGVSNLETTAAFAAIANQGIYTSPSFYSKVLDHDGNVILENETVTRQVMKESTAALLTDAMGDTLKAAGATATGAKLEDRSMGQAAKTGSSTDYNDIWISGYTPYYTVTVWSGYDNNRSQTDFSTYHLPIWKSIMDQIHEGLDPVAFTIPDSVTRATICTKCGKLAVDGLCSNALGGSAAASEYFAVGSVPTEKCSCHVKLRVCKKSKKLAGDDCPEKDVQEIVYLIKDESITQNNKSGDPVTSYYTTKDTPYILPKNLENSVCTSHKPDPDPDEDLPEKDDKPIQIPDPVDDDPIMIDDPEEEDNEEDETGNGEGEDEGTDAQRSGEETTGDEEENGGEDSEES